VSFRAAGPRWEAYDPRTMTTAHSQSPLGTAERPVRVAIVGAGPAGFFLADALLRREAPVFDVDVLERLPTPFGLVRAGVAPDHQQIKGVTKTFAKTAAHARFRFLGGVRVGHDVAVEELRAHYDQVVFAIGSAGDRRLGVPGEELAGVHAGTAFVGWYNAHPDFVDFPFALDAERAVVVGVGNVAMDIARVLLRSPDELAKTDIAGHALEALRTSKVREVVLLARRGPAQAAFDERELRDIAALEGVRVEIDRSVVEAAAALAGELDPASRKNVQLMQSLAEAEPRDATRTLRLEFLASPIELRGNAEGRICAVAIERNRLSRDARGQWQARGTGELFEIEAGLLFRSVGYFGVPLAGVPFDEKNGIVKNVDGRVHDGEGPMLGVYAVGWCRRGPSGVIGTNKADANAVAEKLIEDVPSLHATTAHARTHAAFDAHLVARGAHVTTFADWLSLDRVEIEAGQGRGKIREKFTSVAQMMNHLLRAAGPSDGADEA
jgi:ferredoxin--NADP+ reductase